MRITCPNCGERDRREFYYRGAALEQPAADADLDVWHQHVNLRENPAGPLEELWYHEMGCGAWLKVLRNTTSHEILEVTLASDAGLGGAA